MKIGNIMLVEGVACVVKSMDVSKTGKHGASKVRMETVGIIDDKKRIVTVPGSERFEIPNIDKRRAQILSVNKEGKKASVMDLESFETFDALIDPEVLDKIQEGSQVEYWIITGQYLIKRLI
jgi:translation initiation factor 5A